MNIQQKFPQIIIKHMKIKVPKIVNNPRKVHVMFQYHALENRQKIHTIYRMNISV